MAAAHMKEPVILQEEEWTTQKCKTMAVCVELLAHSITKFSVLWETEQRFLPVIFPLSLSLLFFISSFLLIFLFLCPTVGFLAISHLYFHNAEFCLFFSYLSDLSSPQCYIKCSAYLKEIF